MKERVCFFGGSGLGWDSPSFLGLLGQKNKISCELNVKAWRRREKGRRGGGGQDDDDGMCMVWWWWWWWRWWSLVKIMYGESTLMVWVGIYFSMYM